MGEIPSLTIDYLARLTYTRETKELLVISGLLGITKVTLPSREAAWLLPNIYLMLMIATIYFRYMETLPRSEVISVPWERILSAMVFHGWMTFFLDACSIFLGIRIVGSSEQLQELITVGWNRGYRGQLVVYSLLWTAKDIARERVLINVLGLGLAWLKSMKMEFLAENQRQRRRQGQGQERLEEQEVTG